VPFICIPSFIKIGSAIQKFKRGNRHTDTKAHNQHCINFHQNKETRLKIGDEGLVKGDRHVKKFGNNWFNE
jgi:hypothetical protein